MTIKNTNQVVDVNKYSSEFDRIFGEKNSLENATGVYKYDRESGSLLKMDSVTPHSVKRIIEPLLEHGVRKLDPITVTPRRVEC